MVDINGFVLGHGNLRGNQDVGVIFSIGGSSRELQYTGGVCVDAPFSASQQATAGWADKLEVKEL